MRIPNGVHEARPWRVHEVADDFELLDVWRFDIEGGEGELERFLELHEAGLEGDPVDAPVTAALFRLRHSLGRIFGWDEGPTLKIPGSSETSVRERLPEPERATPTGTGPFERVYVKRHECLHEISNRTVHALMHLGWVQVDDHWAPEMAVYVKPRGWFGRAYMLVIDPFRHRVVYPALMRQARRDWVTARTQRAS